MGMAAWDSISTIEQLLALPEDGLRHELLDGEHVVTPAPNRRHQRAVVAFVDALQESLRGSSEVEVLTAPADIHLGPKTLVQPDVFVVASPAGAAITAWRDVPVPFLAIEILSPSTAARDRGRKRRLYLEAGVEGYWIVDLDGEVVERWRQADARPEIIGETLSWSLSAGASGSIELPRLFQHVNR